MLKTTCLIEQHRRLGARLVDFGGWQMPVQYQGIPVEHLAVRDASGVFDIGHMGEFFVQGPDAARFLNQVLTNDVDRLQPGQGQYTLLCRDDGGTIDDLYLYRTDNNRYLMVVNASRIAADYQWLRDLKDSRFNQLDFSLEDQSESISALALQGPGSRGILNEFHWQPMASHHQGKPSTLAKNRIGLFQIGSDQVWISCSGYTGEDGFEILGGSSAIQGLWDRILEKGASPAGLGARDTLRTEVCYPLYGHELSEAITPLEAGVGFAVALDKGAFIGKEALINQKNTGPSQKMIAFCMEGKTPPPRSGYALWVDGKMQGACTSGTQSPSLGMGIGLGYLPAEAAVPDQSVEVEIRGRRYPAFIRKKPLYRKPV